MPHVQQIRWGILGTGDIARQFAHDIRLVEGAELIAVASRRQETAERFADRHGVPRRYASYDDLASDGDIDAVYIATPHSRHCRDTRLCLDHGKAVLCEKPLAVNLSQAREMVSAARDRGLFLMEAMWTRFFPAIRAALDDIERGAIGKPQYLRAEFAYQAAFAPESRLFDAGLAGGALLDIGVYPLLLAGLVFGYDPEKILTDVHLGETGVDESAAITLCYGSGARAMVTCSLQLNAPQEALVVGDAGYLRLPHAFYQPDSYALGRDQVETMHRFAREGYGYHFELAEVTAALREGLLECPLAPLDESLDLIRLLDRIRQQWGLTYPFETAAQARP